MSGAPGLTLFEPVVGANLNKQDAIVIGTRLQEIERESGSVTAKNVLADARDPSSPLHGYFEWDDRKAANAARLDRARYLIRSVRIVVQSDGQKEPVKVRAFVHVAEPVRGTPEPGYVGTVKALTDVEHRREVVGRALTELGDWSKRYKHLSELGEVFEAADRARERFGK